MLDETEVSFLKKVQAVKFGYWTLLPKEQIIDDGTTKRSLEPLVFNILLYFILNNDRIITRKDLIDDVWKQNYVDDNAINRAISELRKALKSEKQIGHVVKTHYRTGYSFILPIELIYYQPKSAIKIESALKEEVESKSIKVGFITKYLTINSNKPRYLYRSIVAVFMTLIIGSYYFMTQDLVSPVHSHSAVIPSLEFSEEILSWEKGAIDVPKMSKNNKYLAYSYRTSKNNEFALHIKDMKTLKVYKIVTIADMIFPIAWSEKKSLVYQIIQPNSMEKCEIWRVDLSESIGNAEHKKLFDCNADEIISADLSSFDNRLIYTKYKYRGVADLSAIVSRDLTTGTEFQVSSPNSEERGDYYVTLSGNMDKVAFLRAQPSGTDIFIANKDGSKQSKVYSVNYKINSLTWSVSDSILLWFNQKESTLVEFNLKTKLVKSQKIKSEYHLGRRFRMDILGKDRFILATENQNFNVDKVRLDLDEPVLSEYLNSNEFEDYIAPFNLSSASIYVLGHTKKALWLYENDVRKKLLDIQVNGITSLAISPDDSKLLLTTAKELYIYTIDNFKLENKIKLPGTIKNASWPLNNNILLTYAQAIKTYVWFYNLETQKLIKLSNLQTDSSLLLQENQLLFFNENFQLIQKNIDTGDSKSLLQLENISEIIWTADKDYIYYIKNRYKDYIHKKPLTDLGREELIPISKDKVVVELTLNNSNINPSLYVMYVKIKDNYLLDMKLKE
jgi:DNA-binding winged helix-turn-helix (wHTH) protein